MTTATRYTEPQPFTVPEAYSPDSSSNGLTAYAPPMGGLEGIVLDVFDPRHDVGGHFAATAARYWEPHSHRRDRDAPDPLTAMLGRVAPEGMVYRRWNAIHPAPIVQARVFVHEAGPPVGTVATFSAGTIGDVFRLAYVLLKHHAPPKYHGIQDYVLESLLFLPNPEWPRMGASTHHPHDEFEAIDVLAKRAEEEGQPFVPPMLGTFGFLFST